VVIKALRCGSVSTGRVQAFFEW